MGSWEDQQEEVHRREAGAAVAENLRVQDRYTQARAGVYALADIGSPDVLLQRAADRLGPASGCDRLVVSRVHDGRLVPLRLWQKGVTPGAGDVPQLEVRLSYPLIEAELVNQPGALIVDVAQSRTRVPPQLRNAFGWSSYAVAALTLAGRTIGTLHADATRSERRMDELDREVVAFLADGLTCAYEVAVLRQRLKRHRALQHAAIKQMAGSLDSPDSQTSRSRREIIIDPLSDPMTPRERDVLELLARGLTNQSISRELLISEATVKHHVKHVLRKLGAANRTDAVSRYLQISGADRADA